MTLWYFQSWNQKRYHCAILKAVSMGVNEVDLKLLTVLTTDW